MTDLIVALDTRYRDAVAIVDELDTLVSKYKIGLRSITEGDGIRLAEELKKRGKWVMYDGKWFDIPSQIINSLEALYSLADACTVHIQSEMFPLVVEAVTRKISLIA